VLTLLSPILAVLAAAVKLTSRGSVLYGQERMGLDGQRFRMMKLRTMRVDAEDTSGPVWASAGDDRRTPIGAFLRRFSLDELPQFVNVLRGEMSVVGPRPERPVFVERFRQTVPGYMLRHKVKSGVTGWAQVHGLRGNTSLEKRIEYDIEYIERWSFWLDLKIIGMTLFRVPSTGTPTEVIALRRGLPRHSWSDSPARSLSETALLLTWSCGCGASAIPECRAQPWPLWLPVLDLPGPRFPALASGHVAEPRRLKGCC
jgi:lipopolysaccharide/colanic/teichoic acid biosynthesis glycosyltransferase